MEVSIFETVGLPQGCLLSVRAGNTRRQAPVPLSEPLRFPNLPFNAKQFKVDVLRVLGNAKLDIEAQKEVESYTVDMDVGDNIGKVTVGLTIKEEPSLCGKRACELKHFDRQIRSSPVPPTNTPAAPGACEVPAVASEEMFQAVHETRDYAKEHNIPNLVQEMLQYILRERPATPYSEMAAYLQRLAVERGELPRAQSVEAKPAAESKLEAASTASPLRQVGSKDLNEEGAAGDTAKPRQEEDAVELKTTASNTTQLEDDTVGKGAHGGEMRAQAAEPALAADAERSQLEAEHVTLQGQRAELLQELARIEPRGASGEAADSGSGQSQQQLGAACGYAGPKAPV